MFDKNLVPNGIKKSSVNGRENILKYEEETQMNKKKLEVNNF